MVAVDGHGGALAVDDGTDLALLDQHLLKTNTLSKRMTTILSRLDTRLSRLDKTVAPLGIRDMSHIQTNIDAVLSQLGVSVPAARPQPGRQGSYGSTANGYTVPGGSQADGSRAASIASLETSGLGINAPSPRHGKEQSNLSVMDRTRAIPRPDVLPRFTDGSSRLSHVSARSPAMESPQSVRSQRSQNTMPSPLPVPSGGGGGGEQAILNRGIDPMSPGEFYSAMEAVVQDIEQMQRGIDEGRGGGREVGVSELCTLLENSFGQAAELLVKTITDTIPPTFDPGQYATSTPQLSTYYPPYTNIRPLSGPLSNLVFPAEPTPRSSEVIGPIMEDVISDIAAIRGEWLKQSFTPLGTRIEDADSAVWEGRGGDKVRLSMRMWEAFLTVSECEANLGSTLMPGPGGQQLAAKTLAYPLTIITQTMNQVVAGIKRSLSSQTMTMLDLYASLLTFQPRYDGSTANWYPEAKDIQSALSGPLNALRGMALRSFPERLVDIRAPSPPSSVSTAISETTHNTLTYLESLPSFGHLVENLLRSSGHVERAWLMGASAPPSTAKSASSEGGLINLYIADVLGTLLQHLESEAKRMRRPIGPTFLINNVSHIRNTIMSFKDDIIGPGAEDMLNKSFRDAKAAYTSEWKSLTQALNHTAQSRFNVGTSHDKQSTKEASAAFFDRFAEMEQTCRRFPLNRQDPDLRDRISRDVEELVRTSYSAFWSKSHSKGYDKYLRATPDEISQRVRAVFR